MSNTSYENRNTSQASDEIKIKTAAAAANKAKRDQISNILIPFFFQEIGDKVLDGITHALVQNTKSREKDLEAYNEMRRELARNGFNPNDMFNCYEVANGYIFDLDVHICQHLSISTLQGMADGIEDFDRWKTRIQRDPITRRKAELARLGKFCLDSFVKSTGIDPSIQLRNDPNTLDKISRPVVQPIALFSRNSCGRIHITGFDETARKQVVQIYQAFILSPAELREVNEVYLIPKNIRISRVVPYGILPTNTGVRFDIHIKHINAQ